MEPKRATPCSKLLSVDEIYLALGWDGALD